MAVLNVGDERRDAQLAGADLVGLSFDVANDRVVNLRQEATVAVRQLAGVSVCASGALPFSVGSALATVRLAAATLVDDRL